MGWKGTVRSLAAADRKHRREVDRHNRRIDRHIDKLHRDAERLIERAERLEAKLRKDLIKTLHARFDPVAGLVTDDIQLESGLYSARILVSSDAASADESTFEPDRFDTESATIRPLEIILTHWATLVAICIENRSSNQFSANWVKKSNPSESKVYLIDPSTSRYYYARSHSLGGAVLPGHPRHGLLEFPPLYEPADQLELHFVEVQLSNKRSDKHSPMFCYSSDSLASRIEESSKQGSLVDQAEIVVAEYRKKLEAEANAARSGETSPVTWLVLIVVIIVVVFALAGQ